MRLSKLLFLSLFIISLFSINAESAAQRTIVTVVEGKVMCFELPEELAYPGIVKTGTFIERINDYSAKVEFIKGGKVTAYIPYNLRYEIYDKLQPGTLVLLQKNYRRAYKTEWDIISAGALATAGLAFTKGETLPADPKEVATLTQIADELKAEVKSEEGGAVEDAEGEVVREVTEEAGVGAGEAAPAPGAGGDQTPENQGEGPGPVRVEEEVTPPPQASAGGEEAEEEAAAVSPNYYWVNPTGSSYTYGSVTVAANGVDSAGRDGSNSAPWATVTYALTRVTGSDINLVATEYSTSTGETFPLAMKTNVNIIGRGSSSTTIKGTMAARVITATGVTGVTISGVRIKGGYSSGNGGGIYVTGGSSITVDQCIIGSTSSTIDPNEINKAPSGGGGGIAVDTGSTLTITRSQVQYNTCGSTGGGGIYVTGGTVRIAGSTINYNSAVSGPGGGVMATGSSTLTTTVYGDTDFNGIIGSGESFGSTNNISSNGGGVTTGGGMYISSSTATILYTRIKSNATDSVAGAGAGIAMFTPTATLVNCIISDNGGGTFSTFGGGIYQEGGSLTIMNCTIANNLSSVTTGGIYLFSSPTFTMTNSIVSGNSGYEIRTPSVVPYPTISYCDLFDGASSEAYWNTITGYSGNIVDGVDSITNCNSRYGNPSFDSNYKHAAGTTPVTVGGTSTSAPSYDIAGTLRNDGTVDLGAYERSGGDPPITGRVYDSVTGETISGPTIAIYRSGSTSPLSTTTSNPYTFNVDPGDYYIAVSKDGYGFPSQIVSEVVDGDHGDIFTAANDPLTINIPMDPDGWLVIEKTANKKKATAGEIITYNVSIQNKHWYKSVNNVELVDEIVNGFKYVKDSTYIASMKQQDPTITNHKAVFNIGTVGANSTTNISYQVRVGMGIPPGRYESAANTRKSTTGLRNSNISSVNVEVIEDPLFTRGTIIGKVFNDINGDGWQDTGEEGIPKVRIATEYGVAVETDEDGKYHIADVPAGNHLLKVDPASLPVIISASSQTDSWQFTTDNPYFVKMTEGLLAKVNFGVNMLTSERVSELAGKEEQANPQTRKLADQFFIVALGEGIVRNLDTSGNIDMVEKDDRYDDGVHVDGKLALYLKGKVLGKYLITASLDTDRRPYGRHDTRNLFKNLDPDKYYPVYGDASTVDYSGVDTQDIVYIMIEWDESFAKWGSFNTDLGLYKVLTLYNRTLSGGIINYKSVTKTEFGDTRTELKGFGAFSRQKPAHDEFVGTGGSLYYLRHDNVIEGSEKLRVEVRDRIGKTTIKSIPLYEEKDYEIDYDTGRILLKRPLNSIQQAYTGSIISNDILMGERVYLVVDYEYYSESLSNEAYGGRASQWVGDHIRVGGTYVQEQRPEDDYKVYGGDTTVKLNKDTEINAVYSRSEETQLGSNLSYDGGLSFQEQLDTFSNGKDGDWYKIDGKTKLFNNTDIYLSYRKQDPYYSAADSISQQGSENYIANVASKLTPNLTVGISHITQKYKEEVTVVKTFGEREVNTTTAVLDYQKDKLDTRLEYQHQESKDPVLDYTYFGTIPLLDNDFIAARIGYQLFEWLHPYIRGQVTLNGDANDQGTVGADITIYKNTALNLAETVGTQGNSTLVGLTSKITQDTDIYANLEVGNHINLGKFTKTTYGQSSLLGPTSKAYIEQDYSSYRENIVRGNLLGYDKKITDTLALGLTYERSNVENDRIVIDRDTGSISLAYLDPDLLKANTKLEVRNDSGTTEVRQWVTENDLLWRVTESISLSGRGNWGWTEDRDISMDKAEFYELGTGFSLRPVTWDRLNLIGKYSYIQNLPPDSQWDFIELTESRRHVYAIEGAYDLFRYLQLVGKFAYRDLEEKVGPRDWTESDTYLYIARSNFHIMNSEPNRPFILRGWDLGVEYRILANDQIEDQKDGFLVELDKDIGDYLRMGVGYNFTDYDDDLRNEDNWDAEGWFVRVNGKY